MDVKNILELLNAVELVGVSVKSISKDGLTVEDLPAALKLLNKYEVVLEAIKDIDLVVAEAKDIDTAEAVIVVSKLMSVVKAIKEA